MPPVVGPDSESEPVPGPVLFLVAGLFGKLPAHGDFVRRGWPDETVDAVDRWLTETIASVRKAQNDDDFHDWMYAAPLWRGYVPPGQLGPDALHLVVAPSIDRADRLFALAAGVAGEPSRVWAHAVSAGEALVEAVYEALAHADADEAVVSVADTIDPDAHAPAPSDSVWWRDGGSKPVLETNTVDAALLELLLSMEAA